MAQSNLNLKLLMNNSCIMNAEYIHVYHDRECLSAWFITQRHSWVPQWWGLSESGTQIPNSVRKCPPPRLCTSLSAAWNTLGPNTEWANIFCHQTYSFIPSTNQRLVLSCLNQSETMLICVNQSKDSISMCQPIRRQYFLCKPIRYSFIP